MRYAHVLLAQEGDFLIEQVNGMGAQQVRPQAFARTSPWMASSCRCAMFSSRCTWSLTPSSVARVDIAWRWGNNRLDAPGWEAT